MDVNTEKVPIGDLQESDHPKKIWTDRLADEFGGGDQGKKGVEEITEVIKKLHARGLSPDKITQSVNELAAHMLEQVRQPQREKTYTKVEALGLAKKVVDAFKAPATQVEVLTQAPVALDEVTLNILNLRDLGLDEIKLGGFRDIEITYQKLKLQGREEAAKRMFDDSIQRGTLNTEELNNKLGLTTEAGKLLRACLKNGISIEGIGVPERTLEQAKEVMKGNETAINEETQDQVAVESRNKQVAEAILEPYKIEGNGARRTLVLLPASHTESPTDQSVVSFLRKSGKFNSNGVVDLTALSTRTSSTNLKPAA